MLKRTLPIAIRSMRQAAAASTSHQIHRMLPPVAAVPRRALSIKVFKTTSFDLIQKLSQSDSDSHDREFLQSANIEEIADSTNSFSTMSSVLINTKTNPVWQGKYLNHLSLESVCSWASENMNDNLYRLLRDTSHVQGWKQRDTLIAIAKELLPTYLKKQLMIGHSIPLLCGLLLKVAMIPGGPEAVIAEYKSLNFLRHAKPDDLGDLLSKVDDKCFSLVLNNFSKEFANILKYKSTQELFVDRIYASLGRETAIARLSQLYAKNVLVEDIVAPRPIRKMS